MRPWVLWLVLVLGLAACQPQLGVRSQLIADTQPTAGFALAQGPMTLRFPADHGPHPDYQTEWWYFTGNLETAEGRHFGYQLTFFRRALVPSPLRHPERASAWAADQIYMGHFALTDVAGRDFQAYERFARGAAGLAGAQGEPFAVWLENWSVEEGGPNHYLLSAAQGEVALELALTEAKGPVLHGDRGYSRKGPGPGDASYYYSLTRLETSGTVRVNGRAYQLSGQSWMDHEYSTSALSAGQIGWDWFSIQLDDGGEVMVFQIRRDDGRADPFSSGTLVTAEGETRLLAQDEFHVEVRDTWRSPHSSARYPSRWTITVPEGRLALSLEPYLADQELNVSYAYWEGAVRVDGTRDGQAVSGHGYVEMTGYAGSMEGQF
jgi:predicted secreted hydrolase